MASYKWPPQGSGGVTKLDGMTGDITLIGGTGISIVDGTQTITISSTSSGDVTIGAFGSTPNASGLSISGSQVLNLQPADATHPGGISIADWNTFNNKQNALTIGNITSSPTTNLVVTGGTGAIIGSGVSLALTGASLVEATSSVLTIAGATNAVLGTGVSIQVKQASTSVSGYLSNTDWNTFNNKQSALTLTNLTDVGTDGITIANGAGAVVGASPVTISQHVADTTHNGYLSSTDWNTFNSKGSGTVSSVALTVPTFLSVSGSPVTGSGTLAVSLSGTALPVANGGTGLTAGTSGGILGYTATGTLASSILLAANQVVIGGGAGATPTTLAAGSLNQVLKMGASNPAWGLVTLSAVNTSVTGTLDVANGGTSQTSALSAFNSFFETVATSVGDLIYGGTVGQPTRLAGNITTTKQYLSSTGNGSVALAPLWAQIAFADLSGSVASAQMPALTGDITTSAGTVATTAAATQANIVTLSKSTGVAVHGTNTNDNAAAGYVGEYIESIVSTQSVGTSNQFYDITSISLTAGDWILVAMVDYLLNTGVAVTQVFMGIGTVTGNSNTGMSTGINAAQGLPPTSVVDTTLSVPSYRVSIASTTTYYLKGRVIYSSGTPQVNNARISAWRKR